MNLQIDTSRRKVWSSFLTCQYFSKFYYYFNEHNWHTIMCTNLCIARNLHKSYAIIIKSACKFLFGYFMQFVW